MEAVCSCGSLFARSAQLTSFHFHSQSIVAFMQHIAPLKPCTRQGARLSEIIRHVHTSLHRDLWTLVL